MFPWVSPFDNSLRVVKLFFFLIVPSCLIKTNGWLHPLTLVMADISWQQAQRSRWLSPPLNHLGEPQEVGPSPEPFSHLPFEATLPLATEMWGLQRTLKCTLCCDFEAWILILCDSYKTLSTDIPTRFKLWDGGIPWHTCQTSCLFLSMRMRTTLCCLFCFWVTSKIEKVIMDGGIGREGLMESLKTIPAVFFISNPGYRKTSFRTTNASYSRIWAKDMKSKILVSNFNKNWEFPMSLLRMGITLK